MKPKLPAVAPGKTEGVRPKTIAEWRAKLTELQDEKLTAERTLASARADRRLVAGAVLAFDGEQDAVVKAETDEREAERRLDSVACAIEVVAAEIAKVEAEQQQAAEVERQLQREAIAARIQADAGKVDGILREMAETMERIQLSLNEYMMARGHWMRDLKGSVTRAVLFAELRNFVETGPAGVTREHWKSLSDQLPGGKLSPVMERPKPQTMQGIPKDWHQGSVVGVPSGTFGSPVPALPMTVADAASVAGAPFRK
jgi:hypothetical protein